MYTPVNRVVERVRTRTRNYCVTGPTIPTETRWGRGPWRLSVIIYSVPNWKTSRQLVKCPSEEDRRACVDRRNNGANKYATHTRASGDLNVRKRWRLDVDEGWKRKNENKTRGRIEKYPCFNTRRFRSKKIATFFPIG